MRRFASSLRTLGASTRLEALETWGRSVSDGELDGILTIATLKRLGVSGRISDSGFRRLHDLHALSSLSLSFARISGPTYLEIAKLKGLHEADLSDTHVTDADFEQLAANADFASRLKSLAMQNTRVSDAGLHSLDRLANLKILVLPGATTDAGIEHLTRLSALEVLDASGTRVSSTGLRAVASLPKLRSLDLSWTAITDDAAPLLAKMGGFELLKLVDTKMTQPGIRRLRDSLPDTRIVTFDF